MSAPDDKSDKFKQGAQALVSHAFKIVVLCLLVGLALSWLELEAITTVKALSQALHTIVDWTVQVVRWAMPYMLLGAVIGGADLPRAAGTSISKEEPLSGICASDASSSRRAWAP